MRILLINPPHPSIGSRIPDEHLPPLGLLSIGGPLLDDGHHVELLDAEFGPMPLNAIVDSAGKSRPDVVLLGHSGSTSGHPVCVQLIEALRRALPAARLVYGGVYPTFHWQDILREVPALDVIVRGEGEETVRRVVWAADGALAQVSGIAFRSGDDIIATTPAPLIENLVEYRVGWELADLTRYSYWGGRRAVVVQLSRGCTHACTYCGQHAFWGKWRHRDPVRLAREVARLHREHGVQVIDFADENPIACRDVWKTFLEALIAEKVRLTLVGSARADDLVRDADLLPLYREAGCVRFLLGIETYDPRTQAWIRKDSSASTDRKAISLLRKNGILSMATFVVGFREETSLDHWKSLRRLLAFDPDQVQSLHATPHQWTLFHGHLQGRCVMDSDLSRWDYKHQVLLNRHMAPWRVLLWVKFMEAVMQLRPRALGRWLFHPDPELRHAMRWYYRIGRKVWFHEIREHFRRMVTGS